VKSLPKLGTISKVRIKKIHEGKKERKKEKKRAKLGF
jgi:hypothetical protein